MDDVVVIRLVDGHHRRWAVGAKTGGIKRGAGAICEACIVGLGEEPFRKSAGGYLATAEPVGERVAYGQ